MPRRSSSYSSRSSFDRHDERDRSRGRSSSRTISPQFIRGERERKVTRYRSQDRNFRRSSSRHEEDGFRLHIADLTADISKREIEETFNKFGILKEVWVARNPPCFAFVVFTNEEDAEKAMRKVDNTYIGRNKVRVTPARPRTRGTRRNFYDPNMKCYTCGERGHFSRECSKMYKSFKSYNRSSRSNSRSRSRSRGFDRYRRGGGGGGGGGGWRGRRRSPFEDERNSLSPPPSRRRRRTSPRRPSRESGRTERKSDKGSENRGTHRDDDVKEKAPPVSSSNAMEIRRTQSPTSSIGSRKHQKSPIHLMAKELPVSEESRKEEVLSSKRSLSKDKPIDDSRHRSKSPVKKLKSPSPSEPVNEKSEAPRGERSKSPSRSLTPGDQKYMVKETGRNSVDKKVVDYNQINGTIANPETTDITNSSIQVESTTTSLTEKSISESFSQESFEQSRHGVIKKTLIKETFSTIVQDNIGGEEEEISGDAFIQLNTAEEDTAILNL